MSKPAMNLPAEVHQLVLRNLDLPAPLFRPVYGKDFQGDAAGDGQVNRKYRSYWGVDRTVEQNESVLALLNLAQTSRFYANLLAPVIYETLVIRPTKASLDFARDIQASSKWALVKNLIVCSVYREVDEVEEAKQTEDAAELLRYRQLTDLEEGLILAHGLDTRSNTKLNAITTALKEALEKSSEGKTEDMVAERGTSMSDNSVTVRKPYDDLEHDYDPTKNIDFDAFSSILRKLPPNLQSLTIDTPTTWLESYECGEYLDVFVHETAKELLQNEQEYVYRKQIYTIYAAVCCQDNIRMLRGRKEEDESFEFKLRLLHVSPFPCSIFPGSTEYPCAKSEDGDDRKELRSEDRDSPMPSPPKEDNSDSMLEKLLELVTSFEISFGWWDNGAGWHMNTHTLIQTFAASLPTYLFNHLTDTCQRFTFHGDKSWILGDYLSAYTSMNPLPLDTDGHKVASEYGDRDISLAGFRGDACSKVRQVEISNVFIGREVSNFIKARSATIEHIKLVNCWAHKASSHDDNDKERIETWAKFLRSITHIAGLKLQGIEIVYDPMDTAGIKNDGSKYDKNGNHVADLEIRADYPSFRISSAEAEKSALTRKSKRIKRNKEEFMFGYGEISDKYGDLMEDDDENEESFRRGDDWKAWIELVEVVHKNKEDAAAKKV